MNLKEHYNNLFKASLQKIKTGDFQTDKQIDSKTDNRFGITLLIRPNQHVINEVQKFMSEVKQIEPEQYFYPDSDLHVTVMSIISCYDGFKLSQIPIEEYVKVIQKSIHGLNHFKIEFRGVTASSSCLMVQGFPKDGTLDQMRDNLRTNFQNSNLEQSIDKRYTIQTAHSTILRFKKELSDKDEFLSIVEKFRDHYFGTSTIDTIEFVFNDWYQRKEHVKELHRFDLN